MKTVAGAVSRVAIVFARNFRSWCLDACAEFPHAILYHGAYTHAQEYRASAHKMADGGHPRARSSRLSSSGKRALLSHGMQEIDVVCPFDSRRGEYGAE